MIGNLENETNDVRKNLTDLTPRVDEATSVFQNLAERTESVQKIAENVAAGTQELYDNANNAMETLNNINKSISGKCKFLEISINIV